MNRKVFTYLREIDALVAGKYVPPVTYEIDLSNRCQNRCYFCMFEKFLQENREFISLEDGRQLIKEIAEANGKSITFTGGGEPLTNPHFAEISDLALSLGLRLGLVTNGIALPDHIDILKGFDFVRVSLDAATTDTWEKIKGNRWFNRSIRGIKELVALEDGPDVGISFIILEENKHEIPAIKALAKELDVKYLQIKPDIRQPPELLDQSDEKRVVITERYVANVGDAKYACAIAGLVGQVTADLDMYYCCQHRGKPEFKVGSLKDQTLEQIQRGRVDFVPDISKCVTCRYMNYALGYKAVKDADKWIFLRHKEFL